MDENFPKESVHHFIDSESKGDEGDIVVGSSSKKLKMTTQKKGIKWEEMKTNPIIELKTNPKEEKKAPKSAVFKKLFPAESKGDEGDIVVGSSSKKLKMTTQKKGIKWEEMKTNPIIELKTNPKEEKKAPKSAVFINNKTLQDRELIFKKLFPAESKGDEGDIVVGSSSKKLKMTTQKKGIKWEEMKTDFPLKKIEWRLK